MIESEPERHHSSSEGELERKSGFHQRLEHLRSQVSSDAEISRKIGMSPAGYHRIKNGGDPSLGTLLALANAFEVSVQWLATGEEPAQGGAQSPPAPPETAQGAQGAPSAPEAAEVGQTGSVDKWLFSRVVDGIRRTHQRAGVELPTINEVDLSVELYDRIIAMVKGRDAQYGALRMALDQMDRDLRTPADKPASGKRSA